MLLDGVLRGLAMSLALSLTGCGRVGVELGTNRIDAGAPAPGDADLLDGALDAGPADGDGDGVVDALDGCPADASKTAPGACGCGVSAPPGLSAYWPFDELSGVSARDALRMRLAQLLNFGPAAWAPGQVQGALSLDGIDDVLEAGAESLPVRAISFWLRPAAAVPVTQTPWSSPTRTNPGGSWPEPEKAYQSDNQYTSGGGTNGATADWGGFGFVLSPGTQVTGIAVEIEHANINPAASYDIELSFNGGMSHTSTMRTSSPPDFDRYDVFGGPADSWGRTWSVAELGDDSFRVRLTKSGFAGATLAPGVDHIRARVVHAPSPPSRSLITLAPQIGIALAGSSIVAYGFPAGTVTYVDGVPGGSVGDGFHHVVVVAPSGVTASSVSVGAARGGLYAYGGAIDELKLFVDALSGVDITTLRTRPDCR